MRFMFCLPLCVLAPVAIAQDSPPPLTVQPQTAMVTGGSEADAMRWTRISKAVSYERSLQELQMPERVPASKPVERVVSTD
ncbi:MAG: hypothetical protein AAFR17_19205 [Pseudomonadota bacterium]